jgi:hypothetical protein
MPIQPILRSQYSGLYFLGRPETSSFHDPDLREGYTSPRPLAGLYLQHAK